MNVVGDAQRQSRTANAGLAGDGGLALTAAAHELCNHLQVVSSALSILQRTACSGSVSGMEAVFTGAAASLERAARLSRELVDSGGSCRKPQRLVLSERFDALRETVLLASGPNVRIDMSADEDVPEIWCAPESLEDAIVNVVVNAARAMPNGGRIAITAGREALAGEALPCAVLRIADTGCGMSHEVAARAFEPRFTTRAAGEGSGIGLASVAEFVREAGGSVHLASRLGVGTVVTLRLPGMMKSAGRSRLSD